MDRLHFVGPLHPEGSIMIRRIRGSQFAREFLFGSPEHPAADDLARGHFRNDGRETVVREPLRVEADRGTAFDRPIRSLMVALDGSPAAELALPYALALAGRCGAGVWLVHLHSPFDGVEPWEHILSAETVRRRKRAKRDYLSGPAHRIASRWRRADWRGHMSSTIPTSRARSSERPKSSTW